LEVTARKQQWPLSIYGEGLDNIRPE
jgi:hypothetical protein